MLLVQPAPRDLPARSGPPPSRGQALGNRWLAPRSRPPNPLRRLILRQFLQTAPDRARRHAGCRRHRGNATISRSKRLGRSDQTTAAFIQKRRHRGKPLSDGFNTDHHHKIWYDDWVVNPCFTLPKVDSLISGRALSVGSRHSLRPPRRTTIPSGSDAAADCGLTQDKAAAHIPPPFRSVIKPVNQSRLQRAPRRLSGLRRTA